MTSGPHQVHIQATNSAEPDRSVSSRRTSGRDKTAGQPRGGTQRDHREGPLNPQVLGSSPRGVRTKALVRTLTRAFQVLRRGVRNPILHLRCLTPSVTPRLHLDTWGAALSESLRNRFEAKVDRSGEHNAWTGSRTSDGAGKLKVDGKTVSARRVTWEFARGALAAGVVVKACPDDQACVRVEHLSLRGEPRRPSGGELHGARDRRPRSARACGSSRSRPVATPMGGCAGCIAPCRPTPKPRRRGSLRP